MSIENLEGVKQRKPILCKCAELDWTNVDQTKDHHPDCVRVEYVGFGESNLTRSINLNLNMEDCKETFPMHTGFGVVGMVDESTALEDRSDNEADVLKILAANSRFVVLAVIDELERGTEAGRKLKDLILNGR